MRFKVEGTVAPGYEPVRTEFELLFAEDLQDHAQVCAYVDGVRVVDLWGSSTKAAEKDKAAGVIYDGDTLQTVFSSTKSLTAIAVACLVDRGLLDYQDKICKHWPEFGQNGKEDLKLEDVLRHEAGLSWFDHTFTVDELTTESIKTKNSVGKVIEAETQKFPPPESGTTRQYHGVTRGWILNEVFRRVEPKGRTIGEFTREEISGPLGADANIGASKDELQRYHNLSVPGKGQVFLKSLHPKAFGGHQEVNLLDIIKMTRMFKNEDNAPVPVVGVTKDISSFVATLDSDAFRQTETPSANGGCSARGLARIGACVVNGGELDGVRIFKEQTYEKMHDKVIARKDVGAGMTITDFTQGGVCKYRPPTADEPATNMMLSKHRYGFVGWAGFGGSVFQWRPEGKIGFAYVPTRLHWYDMKMTRGGRLQGKVTQCLAAVKAAKEAK